MIFFLVRNRKEVDAVLRGISEEGVYLCPNQFVFDYCKNKNVNPLLLSESSLTDVRAELNGWGYRFAIEILCLLKERADEKQKVFWESNFYVVKGIVTQCAKFIRTIGSLIDEHKPAKFILFKNSKSLLTKTCQLHIAQNWPKIHLVELPEVSFSSNPGTPPGWKEFLRAIATFFSNAGFWVSVFLWPRNKKRFFFISGGLNHLHSVISALSAKPFLKLVFIENVFSFKKMLFCIKHSIPYITLSRNAKESEPAINFGSHLELKNATLCGIDYSEVAMELLKFSISAGIMKFPPNYYFLEHLYKRFNPLGVLLDEDLSVERRCLAVLAWQQGSNSFVISHGVPGQVIKNRFPREQFFNTSITIVNSELEKEVYLSLYFEPSRVVILGTPRFDELFALRCVFPSFEASSPQKRKIVLLCLAGFSNYDFDAFMPVLVGADSIGNDSRTYIRDLFEAFAGRNDVLIKIKTHFIHEDREVSDYVRSLKPATSYHIESYRENIFRLENEADLIVTPESTVISEAIMSATPVVVLNYGFPSFEKLYKRIGLTVHVRDRAELKDAVFNLLDQDRFLTDFLEKHQKCSSYFYQYSDGKNTRRVVDFIMQTLKMENPDPIGATDSPADNLMHINEMDPQ
jgi:glycosyltransferase involved in cell wall biosynthesis